MWTSRLSTACCSTRNCVLRGCWWYTLPSTTGKWTRDRLQRSLALPFLLLCRPHRWYTAPYTFPSTTHAHTITQSHTPHSHYSDGPATSSHHSTAVTVDGATEVGEGGDGRWQWIEREGWEGDGGKSRTVRQRRQERRRERGRDDDERKGEGREYEGEQREGGEGRNSGREREGTTTGEKASDGERDHTSGARWHTRRPPPPPHPSTTPSTHPTRLPHHHCHHGHRHPSPTEPPQPLGRQHRPRGCQPLASG